MSARHIRRVVAQGRACEAVECVPSRPCLSLRKGYGVRPSRTQSLEDQLGLFLGTKSKIADRSGMETLGGHVTTVADFLP